MSDVTSVMPGGTPPRMRSYPVGEKISSTPCTTANPVISFVTSMYMFVGSQVASTSGSGENQRRLR